MISYENPSRIKRAQTKTKNTNNGLIDYLVGIKIFVQKKENYLLSRLLCTKHKCS